MTENNELGNCTICHHRRGMTNKTKGVRIPNEYGKCTRPLGVCPAAEMRLKPADSRRVAVLPPVKRLSVREEKRLAELEDLVIRNFKTFYEVGCALREIRDTRLYRTTHQDFDKYCRDLFDLAERTANQLVSAANVIDNLKTGAIALTSEPDQMGTIVPISDANPAENAHYTPEKTCAIAHIHGCDKPIPLPKNESQARVLAKLPPADQLLIWQKAVESAPNGHLTALHIKRTIRAENREAVDTAVKTTKKEIEFEYREKFAEPFRLAMVAFLNEINKERKTNWKTTDREVVLRSLRTLHDIVARED